MPDTAETGSCGREERSGKGILRPCKVPAPHRSVHSSRHSTDAEPTMQPIPAKSEIDENAATRMPRQIPYIIGNEACERFSFYGMRNILTPFLVTTTRKKAS